MKSPHDRSSSTISSNRHEEDENIILEPLLPSNQHIEQSSDDFQSVCFIYISRLRNLHYLMSVRSPQQCCFQTLRYIPVLFILGIVAWSYYAYVVQLCIFTIDNVPKKVIYLCLYHPLLILFLWSYYRTMFTPLMGPSSEFYISDSEAERVATAQTIDERRSILFRLARQANLSVLTRNFDGSIRYCFLCQCIKPDRAHHCSVCGKCVLRYDHHCPWTNSCISYGNYKFFILFLGWALLFCIYVAGTSLEYFIFFWQSLTNAQKSGNTAGPSSGNFHLLFLFFVSIMFGISVSSLFLYHLYLTGQNRTTVESFRAPMFSNGPQREGFNLGCKQNYRDVFGRNSLQALIPISTTHGDGIHYQVNSIILDALQQQPVTHSTSDVHLPLDVRSNVGNYDRSYLLNGNINPR